MEVRRRTLAMNTSCLLGRYTAAWNTSFSSDESTKGAGNTRCFQKIATAAANNATTKTTLFNIFYDH
jgi:hypothetical protein